MIDYLDDLRKIINKQFEIDEETIEEESSLEADLNLSDLDIEDIVDQLEEKYQIAIPEPVYANFKNVSDITTYLYENVDQV